MPTSFWALLSFVGVFCLSTILNLTHLQETGKSLGSIKYWIFALLFIIPLYQWGLENRDKSLRRLINLLLISVSVAAVIGIIRSEFQFDLLSFKTRPYHPRTGGFYGYMRYAYNLQFLLLCMFGLMIYRKELQKYYSLPILVLAYTLGWLGLIMSETRGALLGLIAGSVTMIYLKSKRMGLMLGAVAITGVALALLVILSGGSERFRILEKYNSSSNTVSTSSISLTSEFGMNWFSNTGWS